MKRKREETKRGPTLSPLKASLALSFRHMQASIHMFLKNVSKAIKEVDPLCRASHGWNSLALSSFLLLIIIHFCCSLHLVTK